MQQRLLGIPTENRKESGEKKKKEQDEPTTLNGKDNSITYRTVLELHSEWELSFIVKSELCKGSNLLIKNQNIMNTIRHFC